MATNSYEQNIEEVRWIAPEYPHREKGSDWFWIFGIAVVTVIVIALILNNILFAVLAIIAGFTVAMFAVRRPEMITYRANNRGVYIKNELHPYNTIRRFWFDDEGDEHLLLLESKKMTSPLIIIPLENVDIEQLHKVLSRRAHEDHITLPFSQVLMDQLGF